MTKNARSLIAPVFAVFAAGLFAPASASTRLNLADSEAGTCILAGRINQDGRWAPLSMGVTLLNSRGRVIREADTKALSGVKAVRLSAPALLARCHGNQPLPDGDAGLGAKSPAPAVAAGPLPLAVTAFALMPGRSSGQWVELRIDLPQDRVVLLER
jgi:hypothetical protein